MKRPESFLLSLPLMLALAANLSAAQAPAAGTGTPERTGEHAGTPLPKKLADPTPRPGNIGYFSPFGGYAFPNYNKKAHMLTPDNKEIKVFPGDLSIPLVKLLRNAKSSIDIASYIYNQDTWEHKAILAAAAERGVRVRLFLDSMFLDKLMIQSLAKARSRIAVKTIDPAKVEKAIGLPFTTMHEKFGIIDGRHAYNGSANIDINANLKYTENRFFFYDNPEMVTALQGEFDRLWEMGQWLYNPDEKPGKDAHVENK